jgi:hypothetical protein
MNRHRKIISICGFLAAILVAVPASAPASSLLSGYGGPGQGNQAILGAALLNGPRGGAGGGAGGSSSGGSEGASESLADSTSGATSNETGQGNGAKPAASGSSSDASAQGQGRTTRGAAARKGTRAGAPQRPALAASFYPVSERLPAGEQSSTLGLSGADLIYIILGASMLAFVGVFTRRLTRTDAPGRHR